jgi:hypothetical protein
MSDHERDGRPLLLCECQELRRERAYAFAIERDGPRRPEALEDREQQQRVFGRLAERCSLLHQQTCPLHGGLCFGRVIAFDVEQRGYECDLELDLRAAQCRRAG